MRAARTVGWDSSRGEFQFVADDPGPALLVTTTQLRDALQRRDGSWLLRGYTSPDYESSEEFMVQSPVIHLARSLMPAAGRSIGTARAASETRSSASGGLVTAPPAPPLPADTSAQPVSFLTPRFEPVGPRSEVVPLNFDAVPPPAPELVRETVSPSQAGSLSAHDTWIVRYVMTDPHSFDENERELRVEADSDAGALRALHAELQSLSDEPTYRVLAVIPASQH